jgi:hypothetical protein
LLGGYPACHIRRVSAWRCASGYVVACAAALVLALPGSAGASSILPDFPPFPRVKVQTDGMLTVGQRETLYVKKVPRRPSMKLAAFIEPPPSATGCFVSFDAYCASQPLFSVPGTPRLKASKKGRGSLTFVMPPAYEFLDLRNPLNSHPVTLINGQTVHVEIEGTQRSNHIDFTQGIGHSIAVVQVPPAS